MQNWADEFRKWLGIERLRCMVLSPGADGKQQVGRRAGAEGWNEVQAPFCSAS